MKRLGVQIVKLRKLNKSYREIARELDCASSTVAYYCGNGIRERELIRSRKRREKNPNYSAVDSKIRKFKNKLHDKLIKFKGRDRHKTTKIKLNENDNFFMKDLFEKFESNQTCYLSGRKVDLLKAGTFQLDHIIPPSKGGNNTLDNCGLTCPEANFAKGSLLKEELIELCKDIYTYNGYNVKENK